MLWELPTSVVTVMNFLWWPVVMLSVSFFITKFSPERFNPSSLLYREWKWEENGKVYQRWFNIKNWKKKMPDAGTLFRRSFSKTKIKKDDPEQMKRFVVETCRAELAHWIMLLPAPLVLLWNPLWADIVMILAGLVLNLPPIIVQRYNRFQLQEYLKSIEIAS